MMRRTIESTLRSWFVGVALTIGAVGIAGGVVACKKPGGEAPAGGWKVGDKVDVEWSGDWWEGEILEVKGGLYKVHYVGWASSWDESVTAARLRQPTGKAKHK